MERGQGCNVTRSPCLARFICGEILVAITSSQAEGLSKEKNSGVIAGLGHFDDKEDKVQGDIV